MGGRGVKLGKRVKWVYRRKSTPEGTRFAPASDWVVFLVDFSLSSLPASDQIVFLVDFSGGCGLLFLKTQAFGWEWSE